MRQSCQYDQFTCHTDIELLNCKEQPETPVSDIRTMDSNRNFSYVINESVEVLEQEIEEEKEYIKLQNRVRIDISTKINFKQLAKMDWKHKDISNPIHHVFRWIIAVVYRTNETEYQWNEFKNVCIMDDQGVDLQRRIGYMNVVRMTRLECETTKQLMKRKITIEEAAKNNKELSQFISQVFDIVYIITKTYDAGQKIFKIEEELVKRQLKQQKQLQ